MLRAIALALLLANAAYFAWGQGLLAAYGLGPARQSEPERLAQQFRPEALQVNPAASPQPAASAAAPTAAPAPSEQSEPTESSESSAPPAPSAPPVLAAGVACLQAGVFTEKQAQALQPRLKTGLPEGSWSFESSGASVRWIIYMGRFISKEAMDRKRGQLERLGLAFESPVSSLLNPGISLGSYATKGEAEAALAQMSKRGLRTAKIVPERPELPSLWLRLPAADAQVRTRLEALKPLLAGKAVQACA
jgi:hypothetical protein